MDRPQTIPSSSSVTKRNPCELLMPAGSLEKLKVAVLYGADAVYLGTPDMSLRSKSAFTLEDIGEGIKFAHAHGVRVYLTLNLFAHNKDIPKLDQYIETVESLNPDGLIIADPGVFAYVREKAPHLKLHVSTQANVCSWLSVKSWQQAGASLVVLAREVTFEELTEIREKCPDIELEAFVHGAMCMTYSGRCLLSNYMTERGANQGSCANSCRWNYKVHMKLKDGTLKELELNEHTKELFEYFLEEGYREGELLPIEEDERGSYILNAKDLCLLPKLNQYLALGINSFKVEGRGRSAYYAAIVAKAYRMAIDDWYNNPESWNPKPYMNEVLTIPNRGYSYAFHDGRLTHHAHNYEDTHTLSEWEYAGMIVDVKDDAFHMLVKNKLEAGDVLEFVSPRSRQTLLLRIYEFEEVKNGKLTQVINAGTKPIIRIPFSLFDREDLNFVATAFPPYTIVRKERALTKAQWARLLVDKRARLYENDPQSPKASTEQYQKTVHQLQTALDDAAIKKEKKPRTPRQGIEGCCGRGCNGCMIFWYDDDYALARKKLATKKPGALLESDGRIGLKNPPLSL